jgi:hypothetical protein
MPHHTRRCPERVVLAQAPLPSAQVPFIALPDELLRGILRRAWADRPPRPAAEEVRCAAGLASVCRRVRALLRAHPLPLALDFSAAPLSSAQRTWLLDPALAGRVEAASFQPEDALWEQSLFDELLAPHSRTLLRLSGVPLQLVACLSQQGRPDLDLSGLRLTRLGIDCHDIDHLLFLDDDSPPGCLWLWPERLPGTLEELELLGLKGLWLEHLAWAAQPSAGLAGRPPRLRTLRVMCVEAEDPWCIYNVPLLEGLPALPAFEVEEGSGKGFNVHGNLFARVRSVRIQGGGCVHLWDDQNIVATFVDRLCPAGLQAAELRATDCIDGAHGAHGADEGPVLYEIVREMISRCGDRFAVEVGFFDELYDDDEKDEDEDEDEDEVEECCPTVTQSRLAWRRWPAPGAPGLQAARAAHERARIWAAKTEEWYEGYGE